MNDLPGERWLPVPGYAGLYDVSDKNRVRSLGRVTRHGQHGACRTLKTKLLRTSRNNGYLVAYLPALDGRRPMKLYVEATVENLFPDVKPNVIDEISQPGEEWRAICEYEGLYEVSNLGRVRSVGWYVNGRQHRRYIRPKLRIPNLTSVGYSKVELAARGTTKTLSVHRLVATAFVPNPLGLEIVHHKDENRLNNRAENLEWTSRAGNVQDWFDRRRVVVSTDTIERILAASAEGRTPAEILAALPKKRKTGK